MTTRATLIVLPVLDEHETLPEVVDGLLAATDADVRLLVVDDHSSDGTADVAEELAIYRPRLDVLLRAARGGSGRAALDGLAWAESRGVDVVVVVLEGTDRSGADLAPLVAALADHDLVVGPRRTARPRLHAVGRNADDAGGSVAIRLEALRRIPLERIDADDDGIAAALLPLAAAAGLRIGRLPLA